jgi:hypothetical protein
MLRKSYYLTLGIPPNESTEGIRQAFREIVNVTTRTVLALIVWLFSRKLSRPIVFSPIPTDAGTMTGASITQA